MYHQGKVIDDFVKYSPLAGGKKILLGPIATMQCARFGFFELNLYLSGWVGGWVAGLNENKVNSAELGLTGAEFGKTVQGSYNHSK